MIKSTWLLYTVSQVLLHTCQSWCSDKVPELHGHHPTLETLSYRNIFYRVCNFWFRSMQIVNDWLMWSPVMMVGRSKWRWQLNALLSLPLPFQIHLPLPFQIICTTNNSKSWLLIQYFCIWRFWLPSFLVGFSISNYLAVRVRLLQQMDVLIMWICLNIV